MAAFNPYPATYQPYQMAYQPQQQAQQNTGIIWVQGEAGAKSYLVAPNQTVQLWDSEDQVIYLKSADMSGMPSMKIIDYKIRGAESVVPNESDYVSRAEFISLKAQIDELKEEIKKGKSKKKTEETE